MDFGFQPVDLSGVQFTEDVIQAIPAGFARAHSVLALARVGTDICVAVPDGSDLRLLDDIHRIVGCDVEVRVARRAQLREFIERLYPL